MTKGELKQKIRHKIDLTTIGATDTDYYVDVYDGFIDECLSTVANTVLPYQRKIEVFYGGEYQENQPLDETKYYKIADDVVVNGLECKRNGWLYYDTSWKFKPYDKLGFTISIPNQVMSFSKEALIKFTKVDKNGNKLYGYDGHTITELDADVYYINSKTLALPKDGDYEIWYNSEYNSITTYDTDYDLEQDIPRNVLTLIPSYVACECLLSEDVQRAMIYKNEFETLLARLDDEKVLPSYEIKNKDGWTY